MSRRRKVGAELVEDGVSFRVWAPAHARLSVVVDGRDHPLEPEADGYFSGVVSDARAGSRYRFRPEGSDDSWPDPASRFQPEGPHGASAVVDPAQYVWRDGSWRGIELKGAVMYEMHVGTFTPEGTWNAAADQFPALAELGINIIEMMPVHEFPGAFGWGYDGVDIWAPSHLYGTPDELRAFVDEAHANGIAVILDVVYNHFGPDGCYMAKFAPSYFTTKYKNDWGDAINFDGDDARPVREFFIENAACWIDEYHFDGLRLDATQSLNDDTLPNVVREITDAARAAARGRRIVITAENEPQDAVLLRRDGVDAMWNDDWHHSARVALTGRREAYYTDYCGSAPEFVAMLKKGFLYQGQWYGWQKDRRGTYSGDIAPERFVCYLENHDQVANSGRGERLQRIASPGRLRALTALLLLQPQTPLLFQGQEFQSSVPFLYFADHEQELANLVATGRREFLEQFPSLAALDVPRPDLRATFTMCQLDQSEREQHAAAVSLHRDLLRLRRTHPFVEQRTDWLDAAVLTNECFALRWSTGDAGERLLIVNLGSDLSLVPANSPLLAPLDGFTRWKIAWSTEDSLYGGSGMAEPDHEGWRLTAESAVLLMPSR